MAEPSSDVIRLINEVVVKRDANTRWLGITWVGDDFRSNESTAGNFLGLGLYLLDNGLDKFSIKAGDTEDTCCLKTLLRRACDIIRPVHEGSPACPEMVEEMLVDLKHAESVYELRGWRNAIGDVRSEIERPPDDSNKRTAISHPDNPDVRDLCSLLAKNAGLPKNRRQTAISVARKFCGEKENKAKNLLRQARRFPHLWKRADK